MQTISKLPLSDPVIGAREVEKAFKKGALRIVVVANNCPPSIVKNLTKADILVFEGNQSQLGTRIGKPFPVAVVGFPNEK